MKFMSFLLLYFVCTFSAYAECANSDQKLVVLLKLDDLVADVNANKSVGVSKKWEKVTDFLESNGVVASYGIIGESLEKENKAYFDWIKQHHNIGSIEFWNHGYFRHFRKNSEIFEVGEFNGTSAEKQFQSIHQTQVLAKAKLEISLKGFGPHSSAVDMNTFNQLDRFSEISYAWFYKPVDQIEHHQHIIQRVVELESPIFHPNFEVFSKTFANRNKALNYIAMQGHPNEWDDKGFDAFVRTVNWLQKQNVVFCKPSEFLQSVN